MGCGVGVSHGAYSSAWSNASALITYYISGGLIWRGYDPGQYEVRATPS